MPKQKRNLVAVVDDLMFTVKINDAAKRAGLPIEFVKSEQDLIDKASQSPTAVILDLNCQSVDPLGIIRTLKGDSQYKGISLIGYLSHVQGDLKKQAHDAGCDMVLTRSAFSQNLQSILKRHADAF